MYSYEYLAPLQSKQASSGGVGTWVRGFLCGVFTFIGDGWMDGYFLALKRERVAGFVFIGGAGKGGDYGVRWDGMGWDVLTG